MKLTLESLAAHLERQLLGVYLVSGDEPLLVGEAADAIRARARSAGFDERAVHFIERAADWEAVRAGAANLSLFGARRLVEIRLPTGRPGAAGGAALVALVERADPDTLFLVLSARLEREVQSSGWVKAIEARGAWLTVWPVESNKMLGWVRTRAQALGLELSPEALALLAERTEGNLLAAHQELEKLRLIAAGPVSGAAIAAGVADSSRFDVFQLNEAVLGGETERALRMLAGLRAEAVEPTLVSWALVKAMRDLSNTLGGAAPTRSWGRQAVALQKGARRAASLSFASLVERATRADRMVKGRLPGEPWDELALLAAELCGRSVLAG